MGTRDNDDLDRLIAERLSSLRVEDWQPDMQRGLSLLRERRAEANGRRRKWAVIAAVGMTAAIPMMAFPLTRAFAARCVSACVQETAAVRNLLLGGEAISKPSRTFIGRGDRKAAPDFALTDSSGRVIRLSDFRGKVVLLNFWATWCSPCEQEIPSFVEMQRSNGPRGFTAIGVSMDAEGWSAVKPYVQRKKINYPVMLGNDRVAGLFGGLQAIPLSIVIDQGGRVAAVMRVFAAVTSTNPTSTRF